MSNKNDFFYLTADGLEVYKKELMEKKKYVI